VLLFQLNSIGSQSFDIVFQVTIVGVFTHDNGLVSLVIDVDNLCECIFVFVEGKQVGRDLTGLIYFDPNEAMF
jgi:hypothetical protein